MIKSRIIVRKAVAYSLGKERVNGGEADTDEQDPRHHAETVIGKRKDDKA